MNGSESLLKRVKLHAMKIRNILISVLFLLFGLGAECDSFSPEIPPAEPEIIESEAMFNFADSTLFLAVKVADMQNDIEEVTATIEVGAFEDSVVLFDDGTHGDIIHSDGCFSLIYSDSEFNSEQKKVENREVSVIFSVSDQRKNITKSEIIFVRIKNDPPEILQTYVPDPISLPQDSTIVIFTFAAKASDPDGLDDIYLMLVFISSYDSASGEFFESSSFPLVDNGTLQDAEPADSIFTTDYFQIDASNSILPNPLRFVAFDWLGNESNSAFDTLWVVE